MRRDWFTRDWNEMSIGEHVAAVIAGGLLFVAFLLAAVVDSMRRGDDL